MDDYYVNFPCPSIHVPDDKLQSHLTHIENSTLESGWDSVDQLEESSQNIGRIRLAVTSYQQNNFSHKWYSSKAQSLESSVLEYDLCLQSMEAQVMEDLHSLKSSLDVSHKDYVKCKFLREQRRTLLAEGIRLETLAADAGAKRLYGNEVQKIIEAEDNAKKLYFDIDTIFQEVQLAGNYQKPIDHLEEQLTTIHQKSILKRCKKNFPEGVQIVSMLRDIINKEILAWKYYLEAALFVQDI